MQITALNPSWAGLLTSRAMQGVSSTRAIGHMPSRRRLRVQHRSRFGRQLCIGVDAASYGSLDSVAQYDTQTLLAGVLDEAAAAARLDRSAWRRQPQGDGELALVPPDQPEPLIVDDFIRELDATLQLRNHGRVPEARLRLRAALDFGVAYEAPFGFAGEAVVSTARLLASDSLHHALTAADDADLAVALSATVYQTVRERHTSISPADFSRAKVTEKEYSGVAWIRVLRHAPPQAGRGSKPARPSSAGNRSGTRQSRRPAPAPRFSVQNNFHAPVDAGVIGINMTAAPGDQP